MKLYLISGLGAGGRIFERLQFPEGIQPHCIEWKLPEWNESFPHYVERMMQEINPNEPFGLLGYSFGGIMAQEIAQQLSPEKLILLSTVKNREELPVFIKLGTSIPLHKLVPMHFFSSDALLSYATFRKLYDPRLPSLDVYFTHRDAYYLRWSVDQIIHWNPTYTTTNFLHLHGTADDVFPIQRIHSCEAIEKGNHLMLFQKPKAVSEKLSSYLKT